MWIHKFNSTPRQLTNKDNNTAMATIQINIDDLSLEQVGLVIAQLSGETAVVNGHSTVLESAKPAAAKATKAAAPAKKGKAKPEPEPEDDDDELVDEDEDEDIEDEDEEDEEDEDEEEDEGDEVSEDQLEELSLPELRNFAKEQGVELPKGKIAKPKLIQLILDALESGEEEDDEEDEDDDE